MFRQALLGAVKTLRLDSWFNELTGVGTALGKTAMTFAPTEGEYLPLPTLEALYNFDGLAAKIVDAVPKHAMRAPPAVVMPGEGATERVSEALKALGAGACLKSAWTWARLYGGGAVYLGADDGRAPHEPLDLQNLRAVRWLVDVDRRDLYPMTWSTDPRRGGFGDPVLYRLTRMGGTAAETITVHASRLLRFEGVTPTRRRRLQLQGWGDSILQRVYAELQSSRGAFAAGGVLLQEASQGVLKMKGLMEMMAGDEDNILRRRLSLMDLSRSTARSLLLDADGEDYQRVEVGALTGTVDVMDRFINLLAAVSNIPVTVLMGQAPAGLNATGDSDIRSWYDEVAAERTHHLVPQMEQLVRLLLHAKEGPTGGVVPASWSVTYPPLWQPTPVEAADLRAKQATVDAAYVTAGIVTPEEVAASRFGPGGWSAETTINLDARRALLDADAADPTDPTGPEADPVVVAAIIAKVAGRELPRGAGVALLVASMGMAEADAEAVMGEAGTTFFTAPEATHAAEMEAMRAEVAKLRASNQGHQAYTARVVKAAKEGGLELGAFTSQAPTVVAEGDDIAPGDVVEVPAEHADANDHGVAVVLPVSIEVARGIALVGGEEPERLHLTLAYLGKALTAEDIEEVRGAVEAWAQTQAQLPGHLGGIGRFDGDTLDPVWATPDVPSLSATREALVGVLPVPAASEHGYTPHVTLAYLPKGEPTPDPILRVPVTFDRVEVWAAGERYAYPLLGGA